jgi:hypothetical protein
MKPIVYNVYVLMMLLAYVMRRAGTFSMEEKIKMIDFLSYMALNPNRRVNPSIASLPFLSSASGVKDQYSSLPKSLTVTSEATANVVTTPVAAAAYIGSSNC